MVADEVDVDGDCVAVPGDFVAVPVDGVVVGAVVDVEGEGVTVDVLVPGALLFAHAVILTANATVSNTAANLFISDNPPCFLIY